MIFKKWTLKDKCKNILHVEVHIGLQSNHRNQDSSENQKNVIQGQRLDMENRHTQQRT